MSKKKRQGLEQRVFKAVSTIPLGTTVSYSKLAEMAGEKTMVRHVASLLKKNGYPVSVPCHRVIRKDGDYGEYILGREFKKFLIDREKEIVSGQPSKNTWKGRP